MDDVGLKIARNQHTWDLLHLTSKGMCSEELHVDDPFMDHIGCILSE